MTTHNLSRQQVNRVFNSLVGTATSNTAAVEVVVDPNKSDIASRLPDATDIGDMVKELKECEAAKFMIEKHSFMKTLSHHVWDETLCLEVAERTERAI